MVNSSKGQGSDQTVIPAVSEELRIGKRVVETGRGVRVTKTVSNREQIVDEPLVRENVVVERISINEAVAGSEIPTTRYEGDTMVVPVLEEILVIEKHTILKEEVRITRHRREVREPQTVVLRADEVSVEQLDESADAAARDGGERD